MISINKKNYILADEIISKCPLWCKGVRNGREFIKKKIIDEKYYEYARITDGLWIISDGKSVKYDKVIVRKLYLDKCDSYVNEINGENVKDEKGIEKAPNIIHLDDKEKFTDNDGNMLEIETRGTRLCNNIFFKVKDVGKGFGINRIYESLTNNNTSYTIKEDYIYFMCEKPNSIDKYTNKVKKELFLTYEGILRVLFISRSGKTNGFIKWATEKLFVLQMGTITQKEKLVSNVLGVSANVIKEVFKTSSTTIPCVYLFTLNTVKYLRDSMNLDKKYTDDMIVCKYGFTSDLPRRTCEHIKTYGLIKGTELKLKYHSYVDPMYVSNAETDIRDFFESLEIGLEFSNYNELVIIKQSLLKSVERQYKQISNAYAGHIKDMIKEVEDMKNQLELKDEKNKNIVLLKDNEINMLQKNNELLNRDLEIEKLKNQLMMSEHKK
jgi:hypothetical protein